MSARHLGSIENTMWWRIRTAASAVALGFLLTICTSGRAAVIVNDTWTDGTRTDPASPTYSENGTDADADGSIESAWFSSPGTAMAATTGHLTTTQIAASSTSYTTLLHARGQSHHVGQCWRSIEINVAVHTDRGRRAGQHESEFTSGPGAHAGWLAADCRWHSRQRGLQRLFDVHEHEHRHAGHAGSAGQFQPVPLGKSHHSRHRGRYSGHRRRIGRPWAPPARPAETTATTAARCTRWS